MAKVESSQDVVALSDLKASPGKVVSRMDKTHRPVLLTSRGRAVAVVQSLEDYEADTEERAFLRSVVHGLMDLEQGRELDLAEVKKRLGIA